MTIAYNIKENSLHDKFQKSRAKVQVFGGGFGNGKSAALCIKALIMGNKYPGANILLARSTFPKLNSTLRVEFEKWCPKGSIKRNVNSKENFIELHNGTRFNFSYVAQQGKSNESSTSNLLSATYDAILIDQVEDPEITYKDFLDLLGRLRGSTRRRDDSDFTWPTTGPRFLILACNPTRNWVFKKLIKPLQEKVIVTGKRPNKSKKSL